MTRLRWSDFLGKNRHPIELHIEQNLSCNCGESFTDSALIDMIRRTGSEPTNLKKKFSIIERFPINSRRKRTSTIIDNVDTSNDYGKRLNVKGAADIIL
jgi:magnesium-transporting ATPase (P-type)